MSGEKLWIYGKSLPEIVKGYAKDDIWNMDETGVF